ncbi:MAG: STAS/SEC14 domain-containing protein [Acidimicrobiia bacterium]
MIKVIEGLPADVVAIEAVGEVRAGDYDDTLDPAVDAALATHDKISLLYVLGADFDGYSGGAMWEDTKLGVTHWTSWKKIALVTDHGGYADGVKAFAWLIPAEIKVYALADRDEATAWVSS